MEAAMDHSTNPPGGSLLRYPLRSTKAKDAKPSNEEPHIASSTRRVRTSPNVAKSMSELDLSGKEKSVKPPKRFPNLIKSTNCSPLAMPAGNLTPISENQKSGLSTQLNSDTPMADTSKSIHRRKFCVLSSASYWLAQIKLSESASKHSVSIGFFKLALESGVEPLSRIREELKSYILKHNLLAELENITKDILDIYNIHEDLEKLQILDDGSQLPNDVSLKSDEAAKNSAIASSAKSLKPNFLSRNTLVESNKKEVVPKRTPATKKQSPTSRNLNNSVMNDSAGSSAVETSQRPKKLQLSKGKSINKCSEKNLSSEVGISFNEQPKLDKENVDGENRDICNSK
ncbi:uncharacterized protein LOC110030464 [Phalaenopsis equestris]|uniref:uncharacterized protein LOC110030464 n=1 Tax=Phalaenopsis equestris TaxID=78828 RepID=UPI0009E274FA|nr:uncharacterized protein LOC110030464 [Phalaenopsis equestris]